MIRFDEENLKEQIRLIAENDGDIYPDARMAVNQAMSLAVRSLRRLLDKEFEDAVVKELLEIGREGGWR